MTNPSVITLGSRIQTLSAMVQAGILCPHARGCQLGVTDDAPFDRPRSIAGTNLPSSPNLPCKPSDVRGCSRAAAITMQDGSQNFQVGITTGKTDVLDRSSPLEVSVNLGGLAIYRGDVVVGGLGVAGVSADRAEYAAFTAAASIAGLSPLPANPLPTPGAVFLDGIRLPFFDNTTCASVKCLVDALALRPSGSSVIRTGTGAAVRLPYWKFPRNPELK